MAINWLKAVFFIAGGAVVAAGAAYVTGALDIFFPEEPTAVASLPAPQAEPVAPPATAPQAVTPRIEQPAAAPAAQEAARPADTPTGMDAVPEVIVPTFDLVRVEPDGSLVIAGRAAPIATVEIVTGATTIGTGEANETGEFAIVLDEPLKPGDYTIVLRSTTRDAIVATSTQTAIVSVPDNESGQVLALVEQPGAPSRLITVPEAATPKQERPLAAAPQEPPAGEAAAASDRPAAAEAPATTAAASPAAEDELAGAPSGAATSPQPAQESAGAAQAERPQQEVQVAAASAEPAREPAPAQKPRIAVEAVEIEGNRVFVAGRSEVGSRIRVYANDILLGDTRTSDGGRFLVEAERNLPVGDYIVRADLLGANAEVLARAAVPFEREPGEAVAAVAAPEQPAPQVGAASAETESAKPAETVAAGAPAPESADTAGSEQQVASAPAAAASGAAAETEVTGPKLQNVAGAVIIRRGDTLWRISKRVYGRGVRYTTIYLANQDQIADPDRIWPGQVFNVPEKTEKGEDADMSAVADRVPEAQAETR